MSAKAKRIGDLQRVPNTARRFGSAKEYLFGRLQEPSGKERAVLFTESEIERAAERAGRNPEDLLKVGVIQNLLD